MTSFFLISLPIFAVIGVGWAATRTRVVGQGALDAVNALPFRLAAPALLLRVIAGQPLRQSFNPEFYTGYLASGAIIFVLVLGASRVVAARDLSTAAAHATTATVSNPPSAAFAPCSASSRHRSWQPSSVLRMRVQGSPGRFIPDFGSYNDRGICCVDAGFPNRR